MRDRAIQETFYSTGIRRAELCGLQIDDLQVERRSLFMKKKSRRTIQDED